MHEPRPYGLHGVGGELTQEDSAAVELLARRLTNLKDLAGVDSLRMVRTLPDGGYAIAQDMGGAFRVIVHKPELPPPPPPFDGVAVDYIPMLFSGVITQAVVRPGQGVGLRLSEGTRRRIAHYDPGQLPSKGAQLQRFRIDYNTLTSELKPQVETELLYSQYAAQRPTWYSGAMAEVMQIVGGYGRQDLSELPDTPVERARMLIPERYLRRIREQMGNVRLPGYTGLPAQNGQFQYDYKFNNTHAVVFDVTRRPWLLRVDPSGVWTMPLPLIPATATPAFREYMEEVSDQEILDILDRFGGMPSGESFPREVGAFQAWRRAGVIIKVCEVADFYQHLAYSSACGWAFNSVGTEAFNTCYDYDEDGIGLGLAFKMRLSFGPALFDGRLAPASPPDDAQDAARLNNYLSGLYRLIDSDSAENLAIKYKLRRVPRATILARADAEANENDVAYWSGLEVAPIAAHSAGVARVGMGYLYHGAKFANQPQIKFPEPLMGGCVSHDFLPSQQTQYQANCDTIMFGYYVDDELKVVKYFREGRNYFREVENDYEDCMTVGSWTQTVTTGSTSLVGYFYTTDLDERKALAPTTEVTQIVGKDLGYDSKPFFSFDDFFWRPGSLWRNRYFSHKTNINTTDGQYLDVAVCVPYLCRHALLHAKREGTSGSRKTESLSLHSVTDPTSYRYWTNDFIWAWIGGLPVMNGKPYPKDGNPVWVEIENYAPYPCSDFADQGPWIPSLPADYTWLIHPNRNQWMHSGGGGPPSFQPQSRAEVGEATSKGDLRFSIFAGPEFVHDHPDTMYFLGSPDDLVGVFYRDACRNVFGATTYANVSESVDGTRKRWGYSSLVDHQSAHHFIGVINE